MYAVALVGWSPGFVVNHLADLLRQRGYTLGDAFRLATQVAEGAHVVLSFESLERADEFAQAARALNARVELRAPIRAVG